MDKERIAWPRWSALCAALGIVPAPEPVYRALLRAYGETHRHYHDIQHVISCLHALDAVRERVQAPAPLAFALWFHDARYDTRRDDNEAQSAAWATQVLQQAGVDNAVIAQVQALILASERHDGISGDPDRAYFLDIDLSILGAQPPLFDAYDQAIRREYHWVQASAYRAARLRVLTGFLQRDSLFMTAYFKDRYEKQARENLSAAIQRLQRVSSGP